MVLASVRPIVRTSRTAFVCASDYDDRTQFHMFEQKKRTWIKIIFKEIAGLSVILPVRKSEKKSLVMIYCPTKEETLLDRSRSNSLSVLRRCYDAAIAVVVIGTQ